MSTVPGKTNLGLVEYIKSKLSLPTVYMLSGIGRALLTTEVNNRVPTCAHTRANATLLRSRSIARRTDASNRAIPKPHLTIPNARYCFDCVGLIKAYLWETDLGIITYNMPRGSDQNVRGMYSSATVKGPLSTMPDIPGLLVFTEDLGHSGIYVGKVNGVNQYIEATPAWGAWGVTTSADRSHPQGRNRVWSTWGKYHLIEYIEPVIESKDVYTVVRGDMLSRIASRFGMTTDELYEMNKEIIGPDRNKIEVGMMLRLNPNVVFVDRTIEKIVEKEVIKEVIKEVVKEVPVEKPFNKVFVDEPNGLTVTIDKKVKA